MFSISRFEIVVSVGISLPPCVIISDCNAFVFTIILPIAKTVKNSNVFDVFSDFHPVENEVLPTSSGDYLEIPETDCQLRGGGSILSSMLAFAFKSVFDSKNFAQNYTTAINAIKTEANTAEMLRQQIQTNLHQANSVRSLGNLSGLTGLQQELSLYNQLKNIDSQMPDTVTKSKQLMDNLTGQYGASNLSWESFLKSRKEISDSRNSNLL